MCRNLTHYWVFHCFWAPLIVVLGDGDKFKCLGNLSHPPVLSRQAKKVIFFSKITTTAVAGYEIDNISNPEQQFWHGCWMLAAHGWRLTAGG